MAFKFPNECDSQDKEIDYLYRLEEKLRLKHNEYGAAAKEGQINMERFREWQKGTFEIKMTKIHEALNKRLDKRKPDNETEEEELIRVEAIQMKKKNAKKKKDYDKEVDDELVSVKDDKVEALIEKYKDKK